ncbi:MAG: FAD-dependent oxidoreductase [Bryobacterales bacterium]|nr:FAD-dependent oxidoreductase [Bryobacterales bacterium]
MEVAVLGGGLAGLAAAAALGGAGHHVTVLEARPFLGGRATSFPLSAADTSEIIDNCQHILLRCCVNLLDFYQRLGVRDRVKFHREFYFIEPGGRTSVVKAGVLPKPLHLAGSFATLRFLSLADKIAVARGLMAVRADHKTRRDLDRITMLDWLKEKRQTPAAIERFWRQVLVSAINEELDRMAALHGLQVFALGFLARPDSYEMGIPAVPLGQLYSSDCWKKLPCVDIRLRCPVTVLRIENGKIAALEAGGQTVTADAYVSALPFERLQVLAPELDLPYSRFEHSPITGIHLWFDRPVTGLPHGTLLDRTIHWFFNKSEGRYLQLVVSASRSLLEKGRQEIVDLAVAELREFLPAARDAQVVKSQVIKEVRATFSARPGLEAVRPGTRTRLRNFFLAGDWTRSGWPATMEGAVRSGYLAAEAITANPGRFLLPDIA